MTCSLQLVSLKAGPANKKVYTYLGSEGRGSSDLSSYSSHVDVLNLTRIKLRRHLLAGVGSKQQELDYDLFHMHLILILKSCNQENIEAN